MPEPSSKMPRYDDLPSSKYGGRSGWGIFGNSDSLGLLNLQTESSILAAIGLVQRGAVFPLNAELDAVNPPLATDRTLARHRVLHQPEPGFSHLDDVLDNFFPQISSQWDSLAHVAYSPGTFYNGASDDDILQGHRNTIDHWARKGIVARAVLLDLERTLIGKGDRYTPGTGAAFTVADLEAAREHSDVEFSPGCILLLRTGFMGWYRRQSHLERERFAARPRVPGIEHTEEIARYLWDNQVMAIAADNFAVEVWPPEWGEDAAPFGFLHRVLIGSFGMALGELWHLDDLADDCAQDGVYEFCLTSAPLNITGGIGSPPNALAIK